MRFLPLALALSVAAATATPVVAQSSVAAASTVREGLNLVTSEGRRVGRISRINTNAAGEAVSASVIVNSRFVMVPIATITSDGRRATTSLTFAELRAL